MKPISIKRPHWIMLENRVRNVAMKSHMVYGKPVLVYRTKQGELMVAKEEQLGGQVSIHTHPHVFYNYVHQQDTLWMDYASELKCDHVQPPAYPELDHDVRVHSRVLFATPLDIMARVTTPLVMTGGPDRQGPVGTSRYNYKQFSVEHEYQVPYTATLLLTEDGHPPLRIFLSVCPETQSRSTLFTSIAPGRHEHAFVAEEIVDYLLSQTDHWDKSLFTSYYRAMRDQFPEILKYYIKNLDV